MRIGLYINNFGHGGAERVVSRLSSIFFNNGHEVFVIISDASIIAYPISGTLIDLNIPTSHGLPAKIITLVARKKRLQVIKKLKKLDYVVSFLDGANSVNVLAKNKSTKTLVSIRNYQSLELKAKGKLGFIQKLFLGHIYRKADSVVCVSKSIAQDITEAFKVSPKRVNILYNPYDMTSIEKDSSLKEYVTPEIVAFIEAQKFVFVSTGRLSHQKGFWHLLKVFHLLNPVKLGYGLVIIGDGEQEIQLKQLAVLLGIEKNVLFCGYQKNPYPIMKLCSAYILSSLFEGFPNAMVEAMCLGLPIIATDCKSGPREILAPELSLDQSLDDMKFDATYGYLLPPFSFKEDWSDCCVEEEVWANEVMKILRNESVFSLYSLKSKERADAFSERICYEQLLRIMAEC